MKRRDLLKRTAALAAGGALAGCLSGEGDGDGSDPAAGNGDSTTTPTETETETRTETPEPTTVTTADIVESSGSCGGSGHQASVSFEAGVIRITGRLKTPNPCYAAEVKAADYDDAAGELSVSVSGVAQAEMCQQCIGTVSYEATVQYDGSAPGSVAVTHVVDGETTTVTTASN